MFEPKIVKESNNTSPEFEGVIDPIQLLETLDEFMMTLQQNPSEDDVKHIQDTLQTWQIVTIVSRNERTWINEPLNHLHIKKRRPLMNRIAQLIETGGEWHSEHVEDDMLQVPIRCKLPLQLNITNATREKLMDDKRHTMTVVLSEIHRFIYEMLQNGASEIGIFEQPYGVINMNKLRAWLESIPIRGIGELIHSLDVTNVAEMMNRATFSVSHLQQK